MKHDDTITLSLPLAPDTDPVRLYRELCNVGLVFRGASVRGGNTIKIKRISNDVSMK